MQYQCYTAGKDDKEDKIFKYFALCNSGRVVAHFQPLYPIWCVLKVPTKLNPEKWNGRELLLGFETQILHVIFTENRSSRLSRQTATPFESIPNSTFWLVSWQINSHHPDQEENA